MSAEKKKAFKTVYKPLKFKTTSFALTKQKRVLEKLLTQFVRAKYLRDFRKLKDREARIKEIIPYLLVCATYKKQSKQFKFTFSFAE